MMRNSKFLKNSRRKNMAECPKCGGTDIAMILWGLLDVSSKLEKKLQNKKVVLGGCVVSGNDPVRECNDCLWRF